MIITIQLGLFNKIYNKFTAKLNDITVDKINVAHSVKLCPIFVPYMCSVNPFCESSLSIMLKTI